MLPILLALDHLHAQVLCALVYARHAPCDDYLNFSPRLLHVSEGALACTQQGILFRDLKPENVLLAAGSAKLTDFGAAIDLRSERAVSRLVSPPAATC